jgi:putative transcriptional regulator
MKVSYEKLRKIIKDRGMSVYQVAGECGIAKGITTKIIRDENVTLFTLAKICEYLEVDIGDVVEIIGN